MEAAVLEAVRETVLAVLAIVILVMIYSFEKKWDGREYYCTTMMKLNRGYSIATFALLLTATILAAFATLMLGLGQGTFARILFDLTLLAWALYFGLLNNIVSNRDTLWKPGSLS